MSTCDIGNDYVDNAKLSWHVCARCLAFFGTGDVRWLGVIGCCFPDPEGPNGTLYQEYIESGVLKCFRCWEKNDDCVVVSDGFPFLAILGRSDASCRSRRSIVLNSARFIRCCVVSPPESTSTLSRIPPGGPGSPRTPRPRIRMTRLLRRRLS
jgi:hypothetical protein